MYVHSKVPTLSSFKRVIVNCSEIYPRTHAGTIYYVKYKLPSEIKANFLSVPYKVKIR